MSVDAGIPIISTCVQTYNLFLVIIKTGPINYLPILVVCSTCTTISVYSNRYFIELESVQTINLK